MEVAELADTEPASLAETSIGELPGAEPAELVEFQEGPAEVEDVQNIIFAGDVTTPAVRYLGVGGFHQSTGETTESRAQYRATRAGTAQFGRLFVSVNSASADTIYTLRADGVPTTFTATIPAGQTGNFEMAGSPQIAAGARLSLQVDSSASAPGNSVRASLQMEIA